MARVAGMMVSCVAGMTASRSGRPRARMPTVALGCSLLAGAVSSCGNLLDIPDSPRFVAQAPMSEPQAAVSSPSDDDAGGAAERNEEVVAASGNDRGSETPAPYPSLSPPEIEGESGDTSIEPGPSEPGPPVSEAPDAAVPPPDAGVAPVPNCGALETLGPNGNCFFAVNERLTWSNARATCRQRGADWDLTSIRSLAVNQFLAGFTTQETWAGGSDATTEGTWRWANDRAIFWRGSETGRAVNGAYANWNSDEPNGGAGSDCMRYTPDLAGRWADLECDSLRRAVCEGPAR
jgi:hypothetical protein